MTPAAATPAAMLATKFLSTFGRRRVKLSEPTDRSKRPPLAGILVRGGAIGTIAAVHAKVAAT